MNAIRPLRAFGACLLLGASWSVTANPSLNRETPKLAIPDGQSLLMAVHAKGVQIYEGRPPANGVGGFEWVLKGPEATLTDGAGKRVGKHFAGPTWEWSDGSRVQGIRVASVAGLHAQDLPWLLLKSTSNTHGFLADVSYVMRVDTSKGAAPTRPPTTEGQSVRIAYEATYLFLVPSKS